MYYFYGHIVKTIWITFLYASLVPISLVFSLIGLISYYWMQKYLIINRYTKPFKPSSDLNSEMVNLLDLSPIFLAVCLMLYYIRQVGTFWFNNVFYHNIENITYLIDCISIGFACIPLVFSHNQIEIILNYFCKNEREEDKD